MKHVFILLFTLMICNAQLMAQHYLTLGGGFSVTFFDSKALDRFTETYNLVNGPNLATVMKGIGGAEGLRWEVGYRYLGRPGTAVLAGFQIYRRKDLAQYNNSDLRKIELKLNSFYVEYELGHTWKDFFVNGLFTLFFKRKSTLESTYSVQIGEVPEPNKALNGTYESDASFSTDLGIAVGIFRKPILLIGKITYPLFTVGGAGVLRDRSSVKFKKGTDIFPDDYLKFINGEDYNGVANDFDGLKILLTVAFVLKFMNNSGEKDLTF
jgi:hypothetical protein